MTVKNNVVIYWLQMKYSAVCVFAIHMRYHWLRTTDKGHGAVTRPVFVPWATWPWATWSEGWFLRHSWQRTSSSIEEIWWFWTILLVPWLKTEKTSVEQMWYDAICTIKQQHLCHMCFACQHVEKFQELTEANTCSLPGPMFCYAISLSLTATRYW